MRIADTTEAITATENHELTLDTDDSGAGTATKISKASDSYSVNAGEVHQLEFISCATTTTVQLPPGDNGKKSRFTSTEHDCQESFTTRRSQIETVPGFGP